MNQFEKTAFISIIENMEAQLRSFKKMIASAGSGSSQESHKVTKVTQHSEDGRLSDDEDEMLDKHISMVRERELDRIANAARAHFEKNIKEVAAEIQAESDVRADG
jgi:hypothetical protein